MLFKKHFNKDHVHMRLWTRLYGMGVYVAIKGSTLLLRVYAALTGSPVVQMPLQPHGPRNYHEIRFPIISKITLRGFSVRDGFTRRRDHALWDTAI